MGLIGLSDYTIQEARQLGNQVNENPIGIVDTVSKDNLLAHITDSYTAGLVAKKGHIVTANTLNQLNVAREDGLKELAKLVPNWPTYGDEASDEKRGTPYGKDSKAVKALMESDGTFKLFVNAIGAFNTWASRNLEAGTWQLKPPVVKRACKECDQMRLESSLSEDGLCTKCQKKKESIGTCTKCSRVQPLSVGGVCEDCVKAQRTGDSQLHVTSDTNESKEVTVTEPSATIVGPTPSQFERLEELQLITAFQNMVTNFNGMPQELIELTNELCQEVATVVAPKQVESLKEAV